MAKTTNMEAQNSKLNAEITNTTSNVHFDTRTEVQINSTCPEDLFECKGIQNFTDKL